ncbi:hypothetical protein HN51_068881 [Arachis hypogaea]|uniref:CCT domain-containing protein n=1 Tax=Arachis hypogaea TaxID=3818 RepID=A0A444Z8K7_ARAHY|nr:uncharacterized protein LOC107641716 isoform X2 [Arachis ipaensis]XP_025653783.1 uncharacterized protein LOC112749670 isoform X2 [Arachis hypogaea]QHO11026.1 Zinc finger protein CONSTANS-LIKE [Arachis hypogaea]RYR10506.1 hypothetical protein Ahy_B05g078933 [Arachis hypogaea]
MYSDMHGFDILSHMFNEEIPDLILFSDDPLPLFTAQENIIDSLDPLSLSCINFSESQMVKDHCSNNHQHHLSLPHSYLQRSSSCKSFDRKPVFPPCEAHNDTLMDSPTCEWENDFFKGQIRRVFSAGDLQNMHATETLQTDERYLKVGRYSPQERKEKISKYRAKRSQRKFNKTIKYACRKTLADNRVRIRGRFARNDDTSVIPKAPCSTSTTQQDQDEFWIEMIEALNE